MDLTVGSVHIPVSALNLFDSLAILLLVPVFDRVIYPKVAATGLQITLLRKIGKTIEVLVNAYLVLVHNLMIHETDVYE